VRKRGREGEKEGERVRKRERESEKEGERVRKRERESEKEGERVVEYGCFIFIFKRNRGRLGTF
jgi:hypothetical protein